MLSDVRLDAIADFRYEASSGRYRWTSGAGKGQFASKEAILNRTRQFVRAEQQSLQRVGRRLIAGDLNLVEFQREAAQHLKNIHIGQAVLGANGYENMRSEDWLRVGRRLKQQYYSGIDPDSGKRYGLKHLAAEIQQGKVSEAQLLNRLRLYGESGKAAYWDSWKAQRTDRSGVRRLGVADRHCSFCLAQAEIGPRPISKIPAPGCCPQCLGNCKCSIVLSDALPDVDATAPATTETSLPESQATLNASRLNWQRPPFVKDPIKTVNVDEVYRDWQRNGLPLDLDDPVERDRIDRWKISIENAVETGEPFTTPMLSFAEPGNEFNIPPGYDITDGRHRITAFKELGFETIKAIVR